MVTCCTPFAGRARTARLAAAALAALALSACAADPVAWDTTGERRFDPPTLETAGGAPDAAADSILLRGLRALAGRAAAGATAADAEGGLATLPPEAGGLRCPTSLRFARAPRPARPLVASAPTPAGHAGHVMPMPGAAAPGDGDAAADSGVVAVWWAVRPDRSAALYLSRSGDAGRTWAAPQPVDTLDRSERGCERPAPSVTADAENGYVHVAYTMQAPEGPGVFYAHQMHRRAAFERPQVIVYGDRPAATSVASAGDRVVVAYEDPNTGGRPFVSLALSRTAGHAWAERVPVTGTTIAAERPVVALRGRDQVVLGWVERNAPRRLETTDDPRSAVAPLPSGVVVRVGRFRE